MQRSRRWGWSSLLLILLAAGCGDDVEIMGRVGRKTGEKVDALSTDAARQLTPHLEAARAGIPEPPLADRVAYRLRWEQALAGATIEVRAAEGEVELTGVVAAEAQRQRAVELARGTVGVDKVIDSLQTESRP